MDLKILALQIHCKKDNVFVSFSNNITFIYGNAGVGKSTLANLINYALGNQIIKTQVVKQEVLGVSLSIIINGNLLMLDRQMNSNIIWLRSENEEIRLVAKKKYPSQMSFSDYLHSVEGLSPTSMLRGKSSKEIYLSFSNYMWYSYLRQEELDNTFFYLGEKNSNFKELASIYVLKTLLDEKDIAETGLNKEISILKEKLSELRTRQAITREIISSTRLRDINISHEIVKKQREVLRLQEEIRSLIGSYKYENAIVIPKPEWDHSFEKKIVTLGKYEAEIVYLREFAKIQGEVIKQKNEIDDCINRIHHLEKMKNSTSNNQFENNIRTLESIFFKCLQDVRFSYIDKTDHVTIDRKTLVPSVYSSDNQFKFDYNNLSSGGKKTIFKICFALSIHIYAIKKASRTLLPHFIIVDTPMKNISEREDNELYDRLYSFFNNLFAEGGLLKDVQLIIIDKELPQILKNENVVFKHLTNEKPLIPYLNKKRI